MVVYQRFTSVLQDLIKANPEQVESSWTYRWVFGWFREILRVVRTIIIQSTNTRS